MKVLIINGSPHNEKGNTYVAINEMLKTFKSEGVDTEVINVGDKNIPGCKACYACYKTGKCVTNDIVNEVSAKLKLADGIIVCSPVYYASANGTLISFLDRLFYCSRYDKSMKVGASFACARRSGACTTFDQLNKYFTINNMPVVSSNYWNNIYGMRPGEANVDLEGKQVARALALNMSFLIKSIALGKEKYGLPKNEKKVFTHFADGKK